MNSFYLTMQIILSCDTQLHCTVDKDNLTVDQVSQGLILFRVLIIGCSLILIQRLYLH